MADDRPSPGTIAWIDLTVPDAETVRDFYEQVTGWRSEPVDMGEYSDYNMLPLEANPLPGFATLAARTRRYHPCG